MTTALLLIDLQVDYFADDELERCREDLVTTVTDLVERARAAGAPVVELQTVHAHDQSTWALNMREDGQGMALEGTPGAARLDGLPDADLVIVKTRDSGFHGTDLLDRLRELGVHHLVLAGVSTESCVFATAADAYAHDLQVTLVADGTASPSWQEHQHTLELLRSLYRQESVPAAEITFSTDAAA